MPLDEPGVRPHPRDVGHNATLVDVTGAEELLLETLARHPGEVLWMGSVTSGASPLLGLVRKLGAEIGAAFGLRALIDRDCDVATVAPWLTESQRGPEVRTAPSIPQDLLVVCRRLAVVSAGRYADEPLLSVVGEPIGVRMIGGLFEAVWAGALPLEGHDRVDGMVLDDVKRAILHLMAEGAKDEMIARRLGVSLRTCRRHVAEILANLGASSRFQAGARAARLGMVAPGSCCSPGH
ncbi:LuxR C-terminal-related transcriptional regulator [Streptomyces sp. MS06]|uniref:helix-turn-helix transcriptional regulator n=1 Tax=Streptomyces sp. MS06 TaxID=3385974 RepID=UPI0039A29D84